MNYTLEGNAMRTKALLICFSVLVILSTKSQAVIVEGTYNSTVVFATDYSNYSWSQSNKVWSSTITGSTMSGTFSFDTELMPENSILDMDIDAVGERFSSYTNNWLEMTTYVDGKVFESSTIPDGYILTSSMELVSIDVENGSYGAGLRGGPEYFGVFETTRSKNGNASRNFWAAISLTDSRIPLRNSHGQFQSFTWIDDNTSVLTDSELMPGYADFTIEHRLPDNTRDYAVARARVNSVTVTVRNQVAVPEPSSIPLFLMALLGLMLRYQHKYTYSGRRQN
jgi:hypothetical protein